jgi:hypothetical protein
MTHTTTPTSASGPFLVMQDLVTLHAGLEQTRLRSHGPAAARRWLSERPSDWAASHDARLRGSARARLARVDRAGDDGSELVTIVLSDLGDGRTEMRFEQRGHKRPDEYDHTERRWNVVFARLDERLGPVLY